MSLETRSIVEPLAAEAIRLGADQLDVEYKAGYEEVFAVKSGVGQEITRFRSSSPEAASLRDELHSLTKRKRRMVVNDSTYELRGRVYDSFGEDAFCVDWRRV
jgi:hypothetical protein